MLCDHRSAVAGRRSSARLIVGVVVLAVASLLLGSSVYALTPASPPAQPANGPGGSAHDYLVGVAEEHGAMSTGYWLFEPGNSDGSLAAEPMPVVIFFHGYTAIEPEIFRPWIDHIVQRGA